MARGFAAACALFFTALCGAPAHGQGSTDKAIGLQVPFATGGGTDILASIRAPRALPRDIQVRPQGVLREAMRMPDMACQLREGGPAADARHAGGVHRVREKAHGALGGGGEGGRHQGRLNSVRARR